MPKCPNCSSSLEQKNGIKKFCAQIGNPEIAIVETVDPLFCNICNDFYLTTDKMAEAVIQVKALLKAGVKPMEKGVYN